MNKRTFNKVKNGLANPLPRAEALRAWDRVRDDLGLSRTAPRLLTHPRGNQKLGKGGQYGLCLLPHRLSGVNVCPHSTKECRALCINWSGRGRSDRSQNGRLARTRLLTEEPRAFATLLSREIVNLPPDSNVRLNVFSDILWEELWPELFTMRSDLSFYDYSKHPVGSRDLPSNYTITYSASERWTDDDIVATVKTGHNVAVVFPVHRGDKMVTEWNDVKVIDGDVNDSRYSDPQGVIVGLRAKGKAYKSDSRFVRSIS